MTIQQVTEARPDPAAGPLSRRLRSETRVDHQRVDAAYGRFDLRRHDGYAAFLVAQARVLPELEAVLRPHELIPGWRGRSDALRADLAALGLPLPPAAAMPPPAGRAARWGALYVLEGSRLGGTVLAGRIPPAFPSAFLKSAHPPGAWRELLLMLDRANATAEEQHAAIQSAKAVFAMFTAAAVNN